MSRKRSNKTGRNDPCPCGSGRKYKRCHGDPTGGGPVPAAIKQSIEAHKAQELLRQHQQGKGKPIISGEVAGRRVVAVGNTVYWSKNQKTFVDFLDTYVRFALGVDWGNAEIKKPLPQRAGERGIRQRPGRMLDFRGATYVAPPLSQLESVRPKRRCGSAVVIRTAPHGICSRPSSAETIRLGECVSKS